MINTTNLLTQKVNMNFTAPTRATVASTQTPTFKGNLIEAYLKNQAVVNSPVVKTPTMPEVTNYKNNLRTMFRNNEAKILAIAPRTFTAKDLNGNEFIDGNEKNGTLLSAIDRLDEVKSQGFNALHLLPIHPPGVDNAMGTAGSLYAPKDMMQIDPAIIDKNDPRSPEEQFKTFIDECHKRGIKVMLDLPSCASLDMFKAKPELMAMEQDGLAKIPQGWNDIRMFQPWEDEGKRILNQKLLDFHKQYLDKYMALGIDGIRADVARAKPVEFWDIIIPYSRSKNPEFAWLGETYTYEDASPMANMPADRPLDSWKAGFDSIYGQYHIFNEWSTASDLTNYVKENLKTSQDIAKGKSIIGSFATHDDLSPMFHGGTSYCNLTMGLQATLPMLNPYIVDGYQSGDYYLYKYANQENPISITDNHEMTVHAGKLDIFNLSRQPGGEKPEIGEFMKASFALKDKYADIINKGTFITLDKEGDKNDQIITYARNYNGKTLLVVANRNVDRSVACKIKVPTMKADEELKNLLPSYGKKSLFQAADNELRVEVGPARVHVFEINTPNIEHYTKRVYKQNL